MCRASLRASENISVGQARATRSVAPLASYADRLLSSRRETRGCEGMGMVSHSVSTTPRPQQAWIRLALASTNTD
jgi:hypothetical protein